MKTYVVRPPLLSPRGLCVIFDVGLRNKLAIVSFVGPTTTWRWFIRRTWRPHRLIGFRRDRRNPAVALALADRLDAAIEAAHAAGEDHVTIVVGGQG